MRWLWVLVVLFAIAWLGVLFLRPDLIEDPRANTVVGWILFLTLLAPLFLVPLLVLLGSNARWRTDRRRSRGLRRERLAARIRRAHEEGRPLVADPEAERAGDVVAAPPRRAWHVGTALALLAWAALLFGVGWLLWSRVPAALLALILVALWLGVAAGAVAARRGRSRRERVPGVSAGSS